MHRLKQEQQVSPPPPPAHSTSFRWPIPPPLPPPEAHPTTFEWDPTFPSPPTSSLHSSSGQGGGGGDAHPPSPPTIARDRLSSQSSTVTIRLVRLKDYLDSAYLQDPSANAHRKW
ncbi:hypothetical protein TYRP_023292 [Tyrophagus putrescentiae]|nr:hypothetical protein TYRP_023292 [Tyrophagus putrescentiae]